MTQHEKSLTTSPEKGLRSFCGKYPSNFREKAPWTSREKRPHPFVKITHVFCKKGPRASREKDEDHVVKKDPDFLVKKLPRAFFEVKKN